MPVDTPTYVQLTDKHDAPSYQRGDRVLVKEIDKLGNALIYDPEGWMDSDGDRVWWLFSEKYALIDSKDTPSAANDNLPPMFLVRYTDYEDDNVTSFFDTIEEAEAEAMRIASRRDNRNVEVYQRIARVETKPVIVR